MDKQPVSSIIADYILNLKYEDIPEEIINHVKNLMIDSFGCVLASMNESHVPIVLDTLERLPNSQEVTLWGKTDKMSIDNAAMYNSCLIHGLDYDDTHAGSIIHPSASVLTAAFAIGEKYKIDGKNILTAMVGAYEVLLRLGVACKGKMHEAHFHPTGIFAPFAAICVAGKLCDANKETIINAMGLAGSFAAAAQQYTVDGTWAKKLHPAWGVHSGFSAFRFAQEGFIASPEIFEGSQGLYMAHIGTTEFLADTFSDLGSRWMTKEIAFKFYPVCHMMHSHLDILLSLMERKGLKADDIKEIHAVLSPRAASIVAFPPEEKSKPESDYQMRFSIQYALAMAALNGYFSPSFIDPKYMEKGDVKSMIEKITVEASEDAEIVGHFPGEIYVTLNDGTAYHEIQKYEKGSLENSANTNDVIKKYYANIKGMISEKQGEAIINNIRNFDTLNTIDEFIKNLKV